MNRLATELARAEADLLTDQLPLIFRGKSQFRISGSTAWQAGRRRSQAPAHQEYVRKAIGFLGVGRI